MNKLPLELVGEILDIAIEDWTEREDSSIHQAYNLLHSIGLTCKALYAVSNEKLYNRLSVRKDTNREALLQRSLKDRPQLLSYTRHLRASWNCARQTDSRSVGEEHALSRGDQWIKEQAEGLVADWSRCHGLQTVEIGVSKGVSLTSRSVFTSKHGQISQSSPFQAVRKVVIRTDRAQPSDINYSGLPFDCLPPSLSTIFPNVAEVHILSPFLDLRLSVDNSSFKVEHVNYHRRTVSTEIQQLIAPSWASTRSLTFSDVCASLYSMLATMPNLTYLCIDAHNFATGGDASLFPALATQPCAAILETLIITQYTWSRSDDWAYLFDASVFPALRNFECQESTSWLKGKQLSSDVDLPKLSKNRPGLRCRFKIEIRWQFRVSWAWFSMKNGAIREERVEWDPVCLASEEKKREDVALAKQQLAGRGKTTD